MDWNMNNGKGILIPPVGVFLMTSEDKEILEEVMRRRKDCRMEDFGVKISSIKKDPRNNPVVVAWNKTEGYSLWIIK